MKVRREISSIPLRTAEETWEAIVRLVTGGRTVDGEQLATAASVMASLITDEAFADHPLTIAGVSHRLVILLHGADAMEAGENVDALAWNPTSGDQKGDSQGSQKVIQAMSWVKGGQPWMTRPYSEDLRERVVRVVESGTSRNAAAKQFDVSISFVVKLMQRWKQRGTIKADKYGGWKKSKLAPHGDRIRALVMENCDITIDELCVLLAAEGIEAKRSTLGDFLLAQGLSRKKRQPTPPSRSALTSRRREPLGATSNLG